MWREAGLHKVRFHLDKLKQIKKREGTKLIIMSGAQSRHNVGLHRKQPLFPGDECREWLQCDLTDKLSEYKSQQKEINVSTK